MYRYFDIDDLGNTSVMRGSELDEFESFSPEWKEYQKRWKELADGGMSKKDAKKQAQEELGYKPGQGLLDKAKDLLSGGDKAKDPALEGGSNNEGGATTPPPTTPSTAGVGGGLGGSITIAGMQVPTVALLGVAGVAAWYFMKKR